MSDPNAQGLRDHAINIEEGANPARPIVVERMRSAADRIERLTAERDEFSRHASVKDAMMKLAEAERDAAVEREGRLREALTKLRDCDFVITLADRMDAVRDIARQALKENSNGE